MYEFLQDTRESGGPETDTIRKTDSQGRTEGAKRCETDRILGAEVSVESGVEERLEKDRRMSVSLPV